MKVDLESSSPTSEMWKNWTIFKMLCRSNANLYERQDLPMVKGRRHGEGRVKFCQSALQCITSFIRYLCTCLQNGLIPRRESKVELVRMIWGEAGMVRGLVLRRSTFRWSARWTAARAWWWKEKGHFFTKNSANNFYWRHLPRSSIPFNCTWNYTRRAFFEMFPTHPTRHDLLTPEGLIYAWNSDQRTNLLQMLGKFTTVHPKTTFRWAVNHRAPTFIACEVDAIYAMCIAYSGFKFILTT